MYIDIKDPKEHLWYKASKHLFRYPKFREGVRVRELYENDSEIIQECIDLFNSEIQWAGMFNLQTALDRFTKGHRMFSLYDDNLLGYCWVDGDYLYNFFVCRKRVKGDSHDFCNYVCKLVGKDMRLFVVRPNIKGQKFFERVGFTRIDS